MRIVVTGAGGLLGGRLASILSSRHHVTGIIRTQPAPAGIDALAMDLLDRDAVRQGLRRARPDVVVHCAALAEPELCEREPAHARRENTEVTREVARACREEGARLIALSTDLVFDGTSPHSSEETRPHPLMEYGRSKLKAEEEAIVEAPGCVVLRIALVFGRGHGPRASASESIAQRLRKGEEVRLFDDEWRSPVDPESVAQAVEAAAQSAKASGVYHVAGPERLTRFDFGRRVAATLGLDAALLMNASQRGHSGAPRPRDVSLGIKRAADELAYAPRPIDAGIREGRSTSEAL